MSAATPRQRLVRPPLGFVEWNPWGRIFHTFAVNVNFILFFFSFFCNTFCTLGTPFSSFGPCITWTAFVTSRITTTEGAEISLRIHFGDKLVILQFGLEPNHSARHLYVDVYLFTLDMPTSKSSNPQKKSSRLAGSFSSKEWFMTTLSSSNVSGSWSIWCISPTQMPVVPIFKSKNMFRQTHLLLCLVFLVSRFIAGIREK